MIEECVVSSVIFSTLFFCAAIACVFLDIIDDVKKDIEEQFNWPKRMKIFKGFCVLLLWPMPIGFLLGYYLAMGIKYVYTGIENWLNCDEESEKKDECIGCEYRRYEHQGMYRIKDNIYKNNYYCELLEELTFNNCLCKGKLKT